MYEIRFYGEGEERVIQLAKTRCDVPDAKAALAFAAKVLERQTKKAQDEVTGIKVTRLQATTDDVKW